ncbi:MAG: hypothetical protein JO141_18745 [Bradyrhizobium sp.]|nr:hypothetical protein [Bradyrhizobium sp.]
MILTAVATLLAVPAAAADLLPIDRGFYVESHTACGRASNATITRYNGTSFGNAHTECRKPVAQKLPDGSYKITEQCRDMQGSGGPWTAMAATYVVLSRTEFALTNRYGKFSYRYCERSDLPDPWNKIELNSSDRRR